MPMWLKQINKPAIHVWIFDIPDAVGIMVLLNEGAGMLAPDVIHYAFANTFTKRTNGSRLRYPENDGVILISEVHTMVVSEVARGYPILTFTAPGIVPGTTKAATVNVLLAMLKARWVELNRALLTSNSVEEPSRTG